MVLEWSGSFLLPCPIFSLVLAVDSDGLLFCLKSVAKQKPASLASWRPFDFGRREKTSIWEEDTGCKRPTRLHSSQYASWHHWGWSLASEPANTKTNSVTFVLVSQLPWHFPREYFSFCWIYYDDIYFRNYKIFSVNWNSFHFQAYWSHFNFMSDFDAHLFCLP